MTTEARKIRCFWLDLEEYDSKLRRGDKKRVFLRFLRRVPVGAAFELDDQRDLWAVHKACILSRRDGGEVKVRVRKEERGGWMVWRVS